MLELAERFVVAVEKIAEEMKIGNENSIQYYADLLGQNKPSPTGPMDPTPVTKDPMIEEVPPIDMPPPADPPNKLKSKADLVKEFKAIVGEDAPLNPKVTGKTIAKAIELQKAGTACVACLGVGSATAGGKCPICNGKGINPKPAENTGDELEIETEKKEAPINTNRSHKEVRDALQDLVAIYPDRESGKQAAMKVRDVYTDGDGVALCPEDKLDALYADTLAAIDAYDTGDEEL